LNLEETVATPVKVEREARAIGQPVLLAALLCAVALIGVLLTYPRHEVPEVPAPPPAPPSPAPAGPSSETGVAAQVNRTFSGAFRAADSCVVSVISKASEPEMWGRGRGTQRRRRLGSGIVIREDGVVLTNNHVVEGGGDLTVVLPDGRRLRATLLGRDPRTDVAVLRVNARGLPVARLGDSDRVRVGEWVLCIGNLLNLSHTLTVGVVGGKGRSNLEVAEYEDFIQTDAALNPGNSGGALVDLRGEVIGMNTAVGNPEGEYRGVGFAIPINMALRIAEDLISKGRVVRGDVGMSSQDLDEGLMRAFGREAATGALVCDVERGGPADRAGIRPYDLIVSFEGREVRGRAWLDNRIAAARPGREVGLGVVRNGEVFSARLTVGQAPDRTMPEASPSDVDRFGLDVEDPSAEMVRSLGYEGEHGVLVTDVAPGSVAAAAGFQWGDLILEVNRRVLRSQADYRRILGQAQGGDFIVFRIRRGEARVVLAAQMPQGPGV
jgi:serine protease Do